MKRWFYARSWPVASKTECNQRKTECAQSEGHVSVAALSERRNRYDPALRERRYSSLSSLCCLKTFYVTVQRHLVVRHGFKDGRGAVSESPFPQKVADDLPGDVMPIHCQQIHGRVRRRSQQAGRWSIRQHDATVF